MWSPSRLYIGPLLFLLYINDLPGCLTYSIPSMYADDTSITSSGTDIHLIELKVNEDLKQLENWLVTNRLSINVVKTEFMIIGSRQRLGQVNVDLNLKIGETNLKRKKQCHWVSP